MASLTSEIGLDAMAEPRPTAPASELQLELPAAPAGPEQPLSQSADPSSPSDTSDRGTSGPERRDSNSDSDSDSGDSDVSDVSNISGLNWKPNAGPICWVQEQIGSGTDPREVLLALRPGLKHIPAHIDDITLWKIVIEILSEPPRREKLRHVNTLSDVTRLIRGARNIIVLTGAGVSVSCGIPDFRSRDGIYARLAVDFPDLPDPQAMFDIHYFRRDPRPFFKFAREIYPGQFRPSPCHRFIRMLERQGKLLRNYTQNIDTLEQQAGIENVIQCHGSFATATCQQCRYKAPAAAIREAIFEQTIPQCPRCSPAPLPPPTTAAAADGDEGIGRGAAEDGGWPAAAESGPDAADEDTGDSGFGTSGRETDDELTRAGAGRRLAPIMKPDIVFFGEGLSDEFHSSMERDRDRCDLLIVIGSSLKVRPVALIPSSVGPEVAQILINREPLPHLNCDVQLLGDCDVIIDHLCHLLGGSFEELQQRAPLTELSELPARPEAPPAAADPA
ncbi:NAD-dependent protein deacetylase sirtuin-1-like, partial [Pollicipes pollicipes]|uniref:NAD-dependent protein deacetylase sirtuin-1-like n=1 Tax=Pollicipes pollicipes TaxID=41117 RepID=UPI001884DA1B